jgi:hypothetical protein
LLWLGLSSAALHWQHRNERVPADAATAAVTAALRQCTDHQQQQQQQGCGFDPWHEQLLLALRVQAAELPVLLAVSLQQDGKACERSQVPETLALVLRDLHMSHRVTMAVDWNSSSSGSQLLSSDLHFPVIFTLVELLLLSEAESVAKEPQDFALLRHCLDALNAVVQDALAADDIASAAVSAAAAAASAEVRPEQQRQAVTSAAAVPCKGRTAVLLNPVLQLAPLVGSAARRGSRNATHGAAAAAAEEEDAAAHKDAKLVSSKFLELLLKLVGPESTPSGEPVGCCRRCCCHVLSCHCVLSLSALQQVAGVLTSHSIASSCCPHLRES